MFPSPIKPVVEVTVEMHGERRMMTTLQPHLIGKVRTIK